MRDVEADDAGTLERIAGLHVQLLGFGPLAAFGPRLVREFGYHLPMKAGLLELSVYEAEGDVGGFIATTTNPESLYRRTAARYWPQLSALMLTSLLESPRRLPSFVRAVRIWLSRALPPEGGSVGMGEVVAIAVRPEYADIQFVRQHKVRISEALLDHAIAAFRRQNLTRLRGLLDANNPAPQLLYGRRGARFRSFTQGGLEMVEAMLELR
jgi:hypothetical protein